MIIRNLWNRRRSNLWLFIELILVSILTWVIVDPIAVVTSDLNMPLGYDSDRLVALQLNSYPNSSELYRAENDSVDTANSQLDAIMAKLRAYPEVKYASCIYNMWGGAPGMSSTSWSHFFTGDSILDKKIKNVLVFEVDAGENTLETFGFKSIPGSMTVEEISSTPLGDREIVLSKEMAERYFPGRNAIGQYLISGIDRETGDTSKVKVVGLVSGVKWHSMMRSYDLVVKSSAPDRKRKLKSLKIVLRLNDNTDRNDFIAAFKPWAAKNLCEGNYFVQSVLSYDDVIRKTENDYRIHSQNTLKYILGAFFVVNLILGTIGCFWLQTRRRVEEIGVRRSFGATRGRIVRMLVSESVILATVAFIIGDLIYLQYAIKEGLDQGYVNNSGLNLVDNWINHFGQHFIIVSAIVYLTIISAVIIGTLIPAVKAASVNPVDALRDE